ncbi:uncharacterized protein YkuJ [Haloferula luteola]|uniref:Uncharacterized protein YkuJ n=1 Tax=Haloferula luteola TaxID=595692 RepID=A0A840VAJ9_9BACT|nr:hypothetical protein [Haloferula luteola]MBB5350819.1 uncharacterized protein YkuJ [Haloferula luteola]
MKTRITQAVALMGFAALTAAAPAAISGFVTIGTDTKIVQTTDTEGNVVATVTFSEDNGDGTVTYKTQVETKKTTGEIILEQVEILVEETSPGSGTFTVTTVTKEVTTTPTGGGTPVVENPTVPPTEVPASELPIPTDTTVINVVDPGEVSP